MNNPLLEQFKRLDKKSLYIVLAIAICGFILLIVSIFVFAPADKLASAIMNVIAGLLIIIPFAVVQYRYYNTQKEIEAYFPEFVKAIAEGLESNMSLPQSIRFASENNFGPLTPYIHSMVTQMSWGVSFENAFFNFTKAVNNKIITRAVSTIVAAHKSGGDIKTAILAIVEAVTEIEKLRRERLAKISGQMLQGYVIYFVFLGVMVGIQQFLIPLLGGGGIMGDNNVDTVTNSALVEEYAIRFRHLAVVQGFFSGIVIGKLAEGSISAGIKHALLMCTLGYLIMIATAFL